MKNFRMKIPVLIILAFALVFSAAISPTNNFTINDDSLQEWDKEILEKANTVKDATYLTEDEKKVVFYSNLARMNGPLFATTLLKKHIYEERIRNNKWTQSLVNDLQKLKPLPPLQPDELLTKESKRHAMQSGNTGKTGHQNVSARSKQALEKFTSFGENCQYGVSDPLKIVMDLLIDENVQNLGHRKNILHPDFRYTGVSIQPHKRYEMNCVIGYAGIAKKDIRPQP
jgi:uncharacterized protein YkwD